MKQENLTTSVSRFKRLAVLAVSVSARRKKESDEFLAFFREVVETMPTEVCSAFGNMRVTGSDDKGYGIILTAGDYVYWRNSFDQGVYFKKRPAVVRAEMLTHLARAIEKAADLNAEERRALLAALVDDAVTEDA